MIEIFFRLYAAHLVADFLLQPGWIARDKRRPSALGAHGAIHLVVSMAALNVRLSGAAAGGVLVLALAHCAIDFIKARFSGDGWVGFTLDQVAHLAAVAAVSSWIAAPSMEGALAPFHGVVDGGLAYLYLAGYVGVVFGGDFLVQKITVSFLRKIDPGAAGEKPGLPAAGRYIGWVERFLIMTFLVTGYGEAIGFLLAAKALVRLPEIQKDPKGHFAEYFLVGTLTSVGLALLGGIALVKLEPLLR